MKTINSALTEAHSDNNYAVERTGGKYIVHDGNDNFTKAEANKVVSASYAYDATIIFLKSLGENDMANMKRTAVRVYNDVKAGDTQVNAIKRYIPTAV